jgi:hypothetical protein
MELTPEERAIRDYYLAEPKLGASILSAEFIMLVVACAAFGHGFFLSEDGRPMIFTGFVLSVISGLRYVYYGRAYRPHISSLLQKYEDEIKKKN